MALTKCRECGKEISTTARSCPHCGAKRTSVLGRIWLAAKLFVALIVGLMAYQCGTVMNRVSSSESSPPLAGAAPATPSAARSPTPSAPRCTASDFSVTALKFRKDYDSLRFTGTVTNNGALPCGVQLKVSTYDASGAVVETTDFWPASIRNISPGAAENFSYFVRFDSNAKRYDVAPIDAKAWSR